MTPKEIVIGLLFVMGVCIFLSLFIIGMNIVLNNIYPPPHEPNGMCIETICPHDYSDYDRICMDRWCTISEDAKINNNVFSLTGGSLDQIKDDAYTRGMIDGRASIFEEQSTTGYIHEDLGVQKEYVPSPYPQWREYANCIARNVCPQKEPVQQPGTSFNEKDCTGGHYLFEVNGGLLEVCDFPMNATITSACLNGVCPK